MRDRSIAGVPVRVVIQQNSIPHYRRPVFEALSRCKGTVFTIVADRNPDTPFLKAAEQPEKTIRFLPARTYAVRIPGAPSLYWQPGAIRIVHEQKPDLVIALGSPYSLTTWVLCAICRIRRIPVLFWSHGLLGPESGPKWWLRSVLYRLASGFLLYGNHAKALLTERGFPSDRLHVVYNSLDYEAQHAVAAGVTAGERDSYRQSLGVARWERLVIFTGRLQPVKRIDMLLDAIALVARKGQRVHVALVGEGRERENLVQQSKRLGIDDLVHFLGEQYDERYLGVALSAADLAVIPSGAGLSIMHAMVYGTPVLIHDRVELHFPEWEAVVEGKTGYFYRFGDIYSLAAKIEEATLDACDREMFAHNCQSMIRDRYRPGGQVEIIAEAVRQTLATRARG